MSCYFSAELQEDILVVQVLIVLEDDIAEPHPERAIVPAPCPSNQLYSQKEGVSLATGDVAQEAFDG